MRMALETFEVQRQTVRGWLHPAVRPSELVNYELLSESPASWLVSVAMKKYPLAAK